MANTLTGLIPDVYEALDLVSREMVGLIPAVTSDTNAARAAVGQMVDVHITPAAAAEDITPGATPPDSGDQSIGMTQMSITKSRAVPFRWTGEEQRGVNSGPGYQRIRIDQIAQAFRTLVNEVETDLAGNYIYASRAYGTAGTTPFGTAGDLSDIAQILAILEDNGAPKSDLHLCLSSLAVANIRGKQSSLFKVNEAGTDDLLRRGFLGDLEGAQIHNSAQIKAVTKGTGASYVTSGSTAVGGTSIALVTGTGTVLAGDVVTFAADSANKYVVGTGVAAPGTIALNKPGARVVIPTANALTVGNSYRANMAFSRNAIVLAARTPALPEEGDMADDRTIITDPVSGISFELAMYKQYRRVRYEIALAWGTKCVKPEHLALLLG